MLHGHPIAKCDNIIIEGITGSPLALLLQLATKH